MAVQELRVDLLELLGPLSKTIDLMSPELANHHMKVAYLACRLAEQLGLPGEDRRDILVAGLLHDIGAFSLDERISLLEFEDRLPDYHAHVGAVLLKDFELFANVARLVRFHHVPWRNGQGAAHHDEPVPEGSHVLHLADRVAVQLTAGHDALGQAQRIFTSIAERKGDVFVPEHVDALHAMMRRDYIWLEAVTGSVDTVVRKCAGVTPRFLNLEGLAAFSKLVCRIIDFKSEFTATHSTGVAAVAVVLGRLAGFTEYECDLIEVAAYLHDVGKLAIPVEVLEKGSSLTRDEWHIMRTHVFYTYQMLEPVAPLREIAAWAGLHQERMDGSGYPFGYRAEEIPLGSRVMAVADVFTALTEERPYRKGTGHGDTMLLLQTMVSHGELDSDLVQLLADNYDELDAARAAAQADAAHEYERFRTAILWKDGSP